jgi:TRAP-type uncharacterized transport system fused permease subunit
VLSEVSPPVGLSPSAAAAVTGGSPFRAMMQAWKYSLPAFLVPFLFAASPTGANLLIVGATPSGFVAACANGVLALFFLSTGVVGHLSRPVGRLERALLVVTACVMVAFPIGPSLAGAIPVIIGSAIVARALGRGRGAAKLPES